MFFDVELSAVISFPSESTGIRGGIHFKNTRINLFDPKEHHEWRPMHHRRRCAQTKMDAALAPGEKAESGKRKPEGRK